MRKKGVDDNWFRQWFRSLSLFTLARIYYLVPYLGRNVLENEDILTVSFSLPCEIGCHVNLDSNMEKPNLLVDYFH